MEVKLKGLPKAEVEARKWLSNYEKHGYFPEEVFWRSS
jgi:hypothetical protein